MSIHNIAKLSGFSPATVSKVINSRPGISQKTEEVIRKTIREAGYKPRPPESRPGPRLKKDFGTVPKLANNGTFAFIPFGVLKSQINSPIFAQVMQGVGAALTKKNYVLVPSWISEKNEISSFLKRNKIDGVFLFGRANDLTSKLDTSSRIPFISILGD